MYNVCDLIGRYIPLLKFLKLESRKCLMIAILSRFLLIPAFYFTAKYGDQGWMIMLTSFLGLSNGYLTVCVLTSAPKGYKVCSLPDSQNFRFFIVSLDGLRSTIQVESIEMYLIFVLIGTGAKCLGKFACLVSSRWYICWGYT